LLRRNFRSGEHLVNWFNQAFPLILPVRNDPLNGAVSYSSAVPASNLLGQGECVVHPVFGGAVDTEADVALSVIARLLQDHPGDTVAVLVRSRTHLPTLLRELRRSRIVYQAVEIDRLTDLPEIIDILALTRAIVHPGDRLAWLALLRSPWIGLDWTDLHELVHDASAATVPELLNDESRIARLSPAAQEILQSRDREIADLLATDRAGSLHDRVERAWFALGGPALMPDDNAVANVYHFIDALDELEIGGTIADNAEFMSQLDTVRVSSSVPAQLKILTMHKAKGLQFDHVVLYGLGRYPASNQRSVLSWLDVPGEARGIDKLVSPIGRRDELEHDPLHHFIEQTAMEKERMERGRLLYVACTRAKQSLHLVGHTGISADGTELKPPAASSLLKLLWPVVESEYASAIDRSTSATAADDSEPYAVPTLRRLLTPWVAPQATVVPGRVSVAEEVSPEPQVEFRWVGQGARLAGTEVHRWLQYLADNHGFHGLRLPENWQDLSRHWLLAKGANPRSLPWIMARVEAAMNRVTDDPRGRWILSGKGSTELALTGVWRRRVESIVIDRLLIDDELCHWIIDYKTSSHEGGDLAGFLRAEGNRYSIQLQKYAAIYRKYQSVNVRTALYFPLLGEFVETITAESLQP
jgi:ATP-dependent exoDNAse (exonuclease V) beta subunit